MQRSAPTRLSLRALRADALRRLLLSERGRLALTVEDVANLPDLRGWDATVLRTTIADLVGDGILSDDGYGRIHVAPPEGRIRAVDGRS